MVEPIFHFLKIHREMILGNTAVVVKNMFCKAPKTLDTVDMILRLFVDQRLGMVHGEMLTEPFKRIVTTEGVREVDGTLPRLLADDGHQFFLGDMLNHFRVDLPITFQKAKNNVFTSCSTAALSFSSATKVRLIHLNLSRKSFALQLSNMKYRLAQTLIHARDRLVVETKIAGQTVCRLLLVEALDNSNFHTQTFQRLLFVAHFVAASDISSACSRHPKRTTENTLSSLQKVGRTTENVLSLHNHADILTQHGYETH